MVSLTLTRRARKRLRMNFKRSFHDQRVTVRTPLHSLLFNTTGRQTTTREKGFTLLELLVVLVVLGLLAGLVAPKYFKQLSKSEVKAARTQIAAICKAIDLYRIDTGHYPTIEQTLSALVQRPQNEQRWNGPYLPKDVPADPWGRPYLYVAPGSHGEYDAFSYGKDGAPGGQDENADIGSWE